MDKPVLADLVLAPLILLEQVVLPSSGRAS